MFTKDGASYNIITVFDNAVNDSDKTFTVPAGEVWEVLHANVLYASSADVGNRVMHMDAYDDSGNEICSASAGAVQTASLTGSYLFMQGTYRETAFVNGGLQVPIPANLFLTEGFSLRFYDAAAVAVAVDDMTVAFQYRKFVPHFAA